MGADWINATAGVGNPNGFVLDSSTVWSYGQAPGGVRAAEDGTHPIVIIAIQPVVAGRGSARSVRAWIQRTDGTGESTTFYQYVPAGGAAALQGVWGLTTGFLIRDCGGGFFPGMRIGYQADGAYYYGRSPAATDVYQNGGVIRSGETVAGIFQWASIASAPQGLAASQVGVTSAKLTWSAPADSGNTPITGYRIDASRDSTFATVEKRFNVGNVSEATATGLTGGGRWFFRAVALNGTSSYIGNVGSVPSNVVGVTMIADQGDIDSWSTFGALPASVEAITVSGLRRAVVPAIAGAPNAILKENNAVSAPATLAADTYGAKRTVTGLTVGNTYRLTASAAFTGTIDANSPNVYVAGVVGIGYGDPITLAVANERYDFPVYEFIATAASHDIAIRLAESVTKPATGDMERLAIFGVTLAETPSDSPFRIQSTVLESSLAEHFDLANNSVGAHWWCDASGVTQFSADLGDASPIATFTDRRADDKREYVGITRSYDTRNVVNDLDVTQHGVTSDGAGGWNADDETINTKRLTSIATWGIRAGEIDLNLYDGGSYAGSLDARISDIIGSSDTPQLQILAIRWNAQEDPWLASQLEIFSRIDVEFRGILQPSYILALKHDVTPKRWMIDITLIPKDSI